MLARTCAGIAVAAIVAGLAPAANAESDVSLTGRLQVVHADDFAHDRAAHSYALRGHDGRETTLRFADEGPHGLGGQEVTVRGHRRGDVVEVAQAADAQPTQGNSTAAATAPGQTRFAVILFEFADAENDGPGRLKVTREQVATLAYGPEPGPSLRAFFKDNSFGILDVNSSAMPSADVFDTVRINARSTDACAYREWGDAARVIAATAHGFADGDYTHVAHVMPKNTCTWRGWSELPGKYTWNITGGVTAGDAASERQLRGLMAHELGHNLNAYHGASLACTDNRGNPVVFASRCTHSEYGDPFTVMGYSSSERTFNAFQKARVSWYAPTQGREAWLDLSNDVRTVTATTSGVVLSALDADTAGVQVLRVPMPGRRGEFYYVELRGGHGYDATDSSRDPATEGSREVLGVTIRYAPDWPTGAATRLLDMTPGDGTFTNAALVPGQAYTDGALTIRNTTPLGSLDGRATLDVTISTKRR